MVVRARIRYRLRIGGKVAAGPKERVNAFDLEKRAIGMLPQNKDSRSKTHRPTKIVKESRKEFGLIQRKRKTDGRPAKKERSGAKTQE